jgi:acetyltransferase-like isoleucine patch superfamily enzyme
LRCAGCSQSWVALDKGHDIHLVPIVIGKNVRIGANTALLFGVMIGDNVIVAV